MWDKVYKIKDSVDIYLVDDEELVVYFMNTRVKKRFRVNDDVVNVIGLFDGQTKLSEIFDHVSESISQTVFFEFVKKLIKSKILIERSSNHILKDDYLERYNRQLNYFSEFLDGETEAELAQKRIIETSVGIIGCGAVGGNIAVQLAMAGTERFILMDYDVVKESDCSRHLFFEKEDIGRLKVEALSDRLKTINHRITTFVSPVPFTPETDMNEFVSGSDFIIDTADEPYLGYTAKLLSEICVPINKAHYIAGGFDAHLASTGELVIPYVTPCASCYANFFEKKLVDWIPEKHPVVERAGEMGGISPMSLFSSSFACIEIIKYIAGLMDMKENYKPRAEFLFDEMNLEYLDPKKDPNCLVCGGNDV